MVTYTGLFKQRRDRQYRWSTCKSGEFYPPRPAGSFVWAVSDAADARGWRWLIKVDCWLTFYRVMYGQSTYWIYSTPTWSLLHASFNWGDLGVLSSFKYTNRTLGDPRDPIKRAPEDFISVCISWLINIKTYSIPTAGRTGNREPRCNHPHKHNAGSRWGCLWVYRAGQG